MKLETGSLLISEPFMADPNFSRSVVLLCEHNPEEGTFGLVMNRKMEEYRLGDIMGELEALDAPVYYGGPVQPNTLHFLHTRPDLFEDCAKVTDTIYWGGNFERLCFLISTKQFDNDSIRFFVGYSGWSPNQLQAEVDQKAWIMANGSHNSLFEEQDKLWRNVLREMGGKFKVMSNFPVDPSLN